MGAFAPVIDSSLGSTDVVSARRRRIASSTRPSGGFIWKIGCSSRDSQGLARCGIDRPTSLTKSVPGVLR